MNPLAVLSLVSEALQLEPVAFGMVRDLIDGLKGKTDADVLAQDATDWTDIVALAHSEAAKNLKFGTQDPSKTVNK